MKGDDIAERLLRYGVCMLEIGSGLPTRVGGRHVASQLIRSGTAGGAHYAEARGAESRADFVHKLKLAAKEVRESQYWLALVASSTSLAKPTSEAHLRALLHEATELTAILMSSAATASRS